MNFGEGAPKSKPYNEKATEDTVTNVQLSSITEDRKDMDMTFDKNVQRLLPSTPSIDSPEVHKNHSCKAMYQPNNHKYRQHLILTNFINVNQSN